MSHDDAAMYDRAIKEGREKEMSGCHEPSILNSVRSAEAIQEDILNLFRQIEGLESKIENKCDSIYEYLETIARRISKLEQSPEICSICNCVCEPLKEFRILQRVVETHESGLMVHKKLFDEFHAWIKILENDNSNDYDERITDLENISAEKRLVSLERAYAADAEVAKDIIFSGAQHSEQLKDFKMIISAFGDKLVHLENEQKNSCVYQKVDRDSVFKRLDQLETELSVVRALRARGYQYKEKKPHKCPVCEGTRVCHSKDSGLSWQCESCEGKGIVWG